YLRKFGLLGPINRELQKYLSDFYHWKKANLPPERTPAVNDFYEMTPLRNSELLFYQVGLTREEAMDALDKQFASLKEFARWIVAQVHAAVADTPRLASDPEYLSAIKLRGLRFDPEEIRSARKSAAVMS